MGFNMTAALGGLLEEGGKQFLDAGKREQMLADKRLDEERENRKLEAQFAKQQALADYNYQRERPDKVADAERDHKWRKEDDIRNYDQQRELAKEGRAESFAHAEKMYGLQMDAPGELGKAISDMRKAGVSEEKIQEFVANRSAPKTNRIPLSEDEQARIYRDARKSMSDDLYPVMVKTGKKVKQKKEGWFGGEEEVEEKRPETVDEYIQRTNPGQWDLIQRANERSRGAGLMGGGDGRITENNVGSMKNPGGKTGFKQYDTPDAAIDDWHKQLQIDNDRGIDTIDGLLNKYSPASDGNRTEELIKEAERVTGFKRGQHINLSNAAARTRVIGAILKQEKPASSFLKGGGEGQPERKQPGLIANEDQAPATQEPPKPASKPTPIESRQVGERVTTAKGEFEWTENGWKKIK